MSLRYALIALLTAEPMTAYEVSKQFGASVAHVWHAPDSQIYPELRRMAEAGLVSVTRVPGGPGGGKKRYAVTDAGREALREWMNTPAPTTNPRDPQYLRAAYLDWADPGSARGFLRAHRDHHLAQAQLLEAVLASQLDGTHPTLVARFRHVPPEERARIVAIRAYAFQGLIDRARLEVAFAERGLALLDDLDGITPTSPGPRRPHPRGQSGP